MPYFKTLRDATKKLNLFIPKTTFFEENTISITDIKHIFKAIFGPNKLEKMLIFASKNRQASLIPYE